jgi:hypothetical protein
VRSEASPSSALPSIPLSSPINWFSIASISSEMAVNVIITYLMGTYYEQHSGLKIKVPPSPKVISPWASPTKSSLGSISVFWLAGGKRKRKKKMTV